MQLLRRLGAKLADIFKENTLMTTLYEIQCALTFRWLICEPALYNACVNNDVIEKDFLRI